MYMAILRQFPLPEYSKFCTEIHIRSDRKKMEETADECAGGTPMRAVKTHGEKMDTIRLAIQHTRESTCCALARQLLVGLRLSSKNRQ